MTFYWNNFPQSPDHLFFFLFFDYIHWENPWWCCISFAFRKLMFQVWSCHSALARLVLFPFASYLLGIQVHPPQNVLRKTSCVWSLAYCPWLQNSLYVSKRCYDSLFALHFLSSLLLFSKVLKAPSNSYFFANSSTLTHFSCLLMTPVHYWQNF